VSAAAPRPPRGSDPYGIGPVGSLIAPILSIAGLVVIALVTLSLLNGQIPIIGSKPNGTDGGIIAHESAAPSNIVIVDPGVTFQGTIVYAKAGNIWVQTAKGATQLTSNGGDSMPSFSPDGQWIYFIRTTQQEGRWPVQGVTRHYFLDVPTLVRVKADGTAAPEALANGRFKQGSFIWSYWMRSPELSPDGHTVAMVTDAPNPANSDVVLQFFDLKTGKFTRPSLTENVPLGHEDPDWRPDGRYVLYVKAAHSGSVGAPVIVRYDPQTGKTKGLTSGGYTSPAYSPDGRYIAATKTSNLGTDVVILDGESGREVLRVTTDSSSWGPVWAPTGDAVAFLHIDGSVVDLQLAHLAGDAPDWTVKDIVPLTEVSGLDPASRPDWFIPAADLPAPTATPVPAATPSPLGSPSPSAAQ
jgi:Tol biopolymer transport system component